MLDLQMKTFYTPTGHFYMPNALTINYLVKHLKNILQLRLYSFTINFFTTVEIV